MIVEQLLSSNYGPENVSITDDGDPMWEDITIANKMVIVINKGLNMGIGKIASQVIEYNTKFRILNYVNNITIKFLINNLKNNKYINYLTTTTFTF